MFLFRKYRLSQKWRTNYLLPYRGCLNVHEKNMEKMFPQKNLLFLLLLLLTIIQCKQRYTPFFILVSGRCDQASHG
jgi:hypothetical protein